MPGRFGVPPMWRRLQTADRRWIPWEMVNFLIFVRSRQKSPY